MTFVALHTGQVIDLAQIGVPGLPKLHAFDLAAPLSRINRFSGHASRAYSVAEHSLHVVTIMERDLDVRDCGQLLAGLLHDAHEAIIGDVTTPVKAVLRMLSQPGVDAWGSLERSVQVQLLDQWGALDDFILAGPLIGAADMMALATERRDLFPPGAEWPGLDGIQPCDWLRLRDGGGMTADDWSAAWREKYSELVYGRREQAGARLGVAA
jgi:Predicted hydrolases of HD superfamily